jgi:hypothetical protein
MRDGTYCDVAEFSPTKQSLASEEGLWYSLFMFDSKKWMIWFVALTLVGSIAGSLIAYSILQKQKEAHAAAVPAKLEKPAATAPVPEAAAEPIKEAVSSKPAPQIDENLPAPIAILSRSEWKAKPPVSEMKPHVPTIISIHHTATTAAPERSIVGKLRGLQDFSQHEGKLSTGKTKPVWPDLPYHYYIDANGKVAEGADVKFVGDTNPEYDSTGQVLVALEGNFENSQPTSQQMEALFKMVGWLAAKYKIPADKITSHKTYMTTACPGKNLESRMDEIRQFAWKK